MNLLSLIDAAGPLRVLGKNNMAPADREITGICYRSDRAAPGFVFVAIKGGNTDGHAFIEDAVRRGAAAVVVEKPVEADAVVIEVPDARRALAKMADAFYGSPSSRLTIVGITGTNGKTTTACLLEHILKENGFKTGVIGTIDCHFGNTVIPGSLTTPEAPDLQARLAQMADAGVTHVVMEVSSHGIVQDRIFGCRFDVGIFTNLSQDHLDFHGTMDAYRAAKTRFFTSFMSGESVAVINGDSEAGRRLAGELSGVKKIRVGTDSTCVKANDHGFSDVCAERLSFDQAGVSGHFRLTGEAFPFHTPLVGRFNLENVLCAAGAAHALGVAPNVIQKAVARFKSVPGRMEKVENPSSRHMFVDYSHTPEALENVLETIKGLVPGRLICIFGCGGDRDRGKRPQMGEIAATLADLAIVTSDNPRTEPPETIINDILAGVMPTGTTAINASRLDSGFKKGCFAVEPDRSRAIDLGIRISRAGDGILIAGKGHETYQILGETTIDFDDREHAKMALARYGLL